jgi:hypothetical protein
MKNLFFILLLLTSSVYSQCISTTTWNGATWSNGMPDTNISVVIDGPYDTANDGAIDCCDITVNTGNTLTISLGDYCNVYGNINVLTGATLFVKSGGSLIPISNTCISTGNVIVERKTPLTKRFDYTYWSSPVTTTIGSALLPTKWEANWTFTFNTSNFFDIETSYWGTFISNVPDGQDDNDDAWTNTSITDIMVPGKGYASMVKSIVPIGTYPRIETVLYAGNLNTGIITIPLQLSQNTATDFDDFNLIGNPYSSAINSNDFIDTNISNISGTLYFWTHSNTLTSTYSGLAQYNFSTNDYAKYTKLGGITSVFGGKKPTNVVGSCQGFLVEAEAANNLIFAPMLMSKAYVNTTAVSFYRSSNNNQKNNLWLNMQSNLGLFSQQLIGYNNETDLSYNKGWDSMFNDSRQILKFYSIEDDVKYDIQARGKFKKNDIVYLGYTSVVNETFTISIDEKEGKMTKEDVYLYDSFFNIWHDLSESYSFSTVAGTFNTRFLIRYKLPEGEDRNIINITTIDKVEVYDMIGQLVKNLDCLCLDDLPKNQIFIVKIYEKDKIVTKKILNKI